jgi:alkaline phosphatase D
MPQPTSLSRRHTLALPVGLLTPIPFVRSARAQSQPIFRLGVASGNPKPDSVVLWTRLILDLSSTAVPVRWELSEDEHFKNIVAAGIEWAHSADGFSIHAEPRGLDPGRWYWYRFKALSEQSAVGRTRTAPASGVRATLRLAMASCQRFDTGYYAAWRAVVRHTPDLVVFLGDYIYEYATRESAVRAVGPRVETLEDFRDRYAAHRSDPALQAAHAAAPWLVIWDDHEVDNDYAGLTGQQLQTDFATLRANAYQAWWENMPVPKAWRPASGSMRIHQRVDWGRLARIHLLDGRQYRDQQVCPKTGRAGSNSVTIEQCPELVAPERSLLGLEQERWLDEGWDFERTWNIVAQTTLMARAVSGPAGAQRFWTDGWDGYGAARSRLLDSIAERRVPGPIVLSGDVHAHVVANLKSNFLESQSRVVATELCCTSISSMGPPQARVEETLAANPHLLYARADRRGYIAVDLDTRRARAELVTVDNALEPDSASDVAKRFVIEASHPGAQLD